MVQGINQVYLDPNHLLNYRNTLRPRSQLTSHQDPETEIVTKWIDSLIHNETSWITMKDLDANLPEVGEINRKNVFLALQELSLKLSSSEKEELEKSLNTINSYRADSSIHWKDIHKKPGSGDMKKESLQELQQQWLSNYSVEKRYQRDNKIITPYIEFNDQGKKRFLSLTNTGSIGVIFTVYNFQKSPIKSLRLISNLNPSQADLLQECYRKAREASLDSLNTIRFGELERINRESINFIEPMAHINGEYKNIEETLLDLLPIRNDSEKLKPKILRQIINVFLAISRSLEESHNKGFAQVGIKLDNYMIDPDLKHAIRINPSLFSHLNFKKEDPFFGSYILRDLSHKTLTQANANNHELATNDLRSLAILLVQSILGKNNNGMMDHLYQNLELDENINVDWLKTHLKIQASQGLAHSDTKQIQHAINQYQWNGKFKDNTNLQAILENKLGNSEAAQELIRLLLDLIIYKQDANGFRNLTQSTGKIFSAKILIQKLEALKEELDYNN